MPKVRLQNTYRTAQGVSIPGADPSVRIRGSFVEVSREDLDRLKTAIDENPAFEDLTRDNLQVEWPGGEEPAPEPGADLVDAVGQSTAENLAAAGFETLEDARAVDKEDLLDVPLVGDATIKNKIRASEDSGSDESDEDGEDS